MLRTARAAYMYIQYSLPWHRAIARLARGPEYRHGVSEDDGSIRVQYERFAISWT